MYLVTIQWGTESSHGEDNPPITYDFDTEAELNSFLKGVDEAEVFGE